MFSLILLSLVVWVSCVYLGCCGFGLSVPKPSDWLERLVPEMTNNVSNGTLNSTQSLTDLHTVLPELSFVVKLLMLVFTDCR